MAQKHLHELLTEAQEPFLLKNYIADRRSQLKKTDSGNKKTKSVSRTSFCNQSCFFTHTHSPDYAKSPAKNRVELETIRFDLSLLLEAAERIKNPKYSKTHNRNGSFAVFGSILKKFTAGRGAKCDKLKNWGTFVQNEDFELGSGCSCSSSRRNSPGESIEIESDGFSLSEKCFCLSPVSTFLSSMQNSPSTFIRSPDSPSPATSPIVPDIQGNVEEENYILKKHSEEVDDYFSPVSILDPPFEDDTTQHEEEEEEENYDIECSYAVVQRAKEQLLERLLRFEKLAELDPIELERCILETKADNDSDDGDEDEEELEESKNDNMEKNCKLDTNRNKLVSDLIAKRKGDGIDERKIVERRVCKKVDMWEKMEFKTKIEMIVEFDLRREVHNGWKTNNEEDLDEISLDVELYIFGFLIEELIDELLWKHTTGV